MPKEIVKEKIVKLEVNKNGLNPKQELFCQLYAGIQDKEFFGAGTTSYIEAYDPDNTKPNWYKTAAAAATRLLKNVKIINRINELLESEGFNDQNVDKQHLFLLNQHADLKTKLGAIKEYNSVKGRIATRKIELQGNISHSQDIENYKEIQSLKDKYEEELAKTLRNKKVIDKE